MIRASDARCSGPKHNRENLMKLCIYHANCTDGIAAAWVVHRHDPTWTFHPGDYKERPPWRMICSADEVLVVDFSYKREVLEDRRFRMRPKGVTVLDHHHTAQEDLGELLKDGKIRGTFDMDRCGALIAWDWLNPAVQAPKLLLEIDKQDRWTEGRDPALIAALRSYPTKPASDSREDFDALMSLWARLMMEESLRQLYEDSGGIYRFYMQRVRDFIEQEREITLMGIRVTAVNAPFFVAEDVGLNIAEKYDGRGACWWRNSDGSVTFSLRATGDNDVSEIAAHYGGGGHKRAAGFTVPWPDAMGILT